MAAWEKVEEVQKQFLKDNNPTMKKTNIALVSMFKKFMDVIPHEKYWPDGPPGETSFQPVFMGKIKTRNELVQLLIQHQSKNNN
jgi:hypothetical protein